ncbi:MAG TPA: hypothetical protein VM187_10810 [Niastella sp.]|nr:hypothetical protein [Niastella sp.]
MKKFLVTILALVYLTSTFGATMRLDCCLDKLVSTISGATTHEDLWNEEKEKCTDDHKQSRLGHEQKRNDAKIRVAKFTASLFNSGFPEHSNPAVITLTETYPVNNAPPQQAKLPLFILHCVHRI